MSQSFLSTAQRRREVVVTSAVKVFAERGYVGTPIAAVAEDAGISPAYVFKLFPGKVALFAAAINDCYTRVTHALAEGAERARGGSPEQILDAMGGAYAELIADRVLLKLQVHALSAAEDPVVAEAVRTGLGRVVRTASQLSGASDTAVQQFVAWGQLCHLAVALDLPDAGGDWGNVVAAGLRHPQPLDSQSTKGGPHD